MIQPKILVKIEHLVIIKSISITYKVYMLMVVTCKKNS